MLRIILVEDSKVQRQQTGQNIKKYLEFEGLDAALVLSTINFMEINNDILSHPNDPYLFFIDIDLGDQLSGIEIANNVRKKLPFCNIVFLTAHIEYSLVIVRNHLRPLDYILKSSGQDEVMEGIRQNIQTTLKEIEKSHNRNDRYYYYAIDDYHYRINYDDILYFVASKKNTIKIYARSNIVEIGCSLKQIEDLEKPFLFRCHKSYIININNVNLFVEHLGEVFLDEKHLVKCPVSIRKLRALRKKLATQNFTNDSDK